MRSYFMMTRIWPSNMAPKHHSAAAASNITPKCDSAAAASNMASQKSISMGSHGIYGMGDPKNILSYGTSQEYTIPWDIPLNPIPYLLVGMVCPPPKSHTNTVLWNHWHGISRGIYHILSVTRIESHWRCYDCCRQQA